MSERPRPEGEESDAAPTAPPLRTFVERSPGRLLMEAALGAGAGAAFAAGLERADARLTLMLAGAVLAPLALLLTPVRGGAVRRGLRYGLAIAVLVTLVVSFTGPGRERPVAELLVLGLFAFGIGAVGHGAIAATIDRPADEDVDIPADER